jgi:type I restriction enzyme R subunit
MSDTAHQEKHFEARIVAKLADQGWQVGSTEGYDTEAALYTQDLLDWLKATQSKVAGKLQAHGGVLPESFKDVLGQALAAQGTVQVLRNGYKVAGFGHIEASAGQPEDDRDQKAWDHYRANILRVVPQLKYRPGHNLAIDLVFFINGLPVATVEVKTDFTQSAQLAVEQYKNDRKPQDPITKRREPLLTFKRGAVVHFAMSESDIQMATKLDGENTFFLPFNKGKDGHAGNPAREDGQYPVTYFWEEICQPDAWLRIFHNFVYVEKKQVVDLQGNWSTKETLIFPRFHQWDAVNKMIADAKDNGPGKAYLCEHSAGSGKTSTIAWTAHDLIKLRKPDGASVFNSVIVVTDRTVLDAQLQDAVQQLDHQQDLIAAIDRDKTGKSKSQQLSAALKRGTPIIVVTIQTFPYAMEAILTDASLKDRNFAVIIDEAHNSQTGTAASKLQATLAMDSKESMEKLSVEELLEKIHKARLRPGNISHFAFTATPKHSTMMLFGRPKDPSKPAGKDNPPQSFHRYPMRQAIEEGFILDVLKGYTPYKTAFNLSENLTEGKRVDAKAAKRALAKWMVLHATNVSQKVEFIVEHFSANVAPLLGGKAKAMVVTSSRAAAVRYKKAFDAYISKHEKHQGLKALVAFSGKLTGKEVKHASDEAVAGEVFAADDEAIFTEATLNVGVPNSDLRIAFDRPEYRVMIVADKFQTGFDQPKLVAMYLDKKIANEVEIVQTLSRLNRMAPGKDTTFVIDFVNEPETVLKAFAKYDAGAHIEDVQDPNVVYKLQAKLDEAKIYRNEHLEAFKKARYQSLSDVAAAKQPTHQALYAATQAPTDTFNGKVKTLREALAECDQAYEKARVAGNEDLMKKTDHLRKEHAQALKELLEFKNGLSRFSQLYAYIAQLIDLDDAELENYAAFARLLSKRLEGIPPQDIDVSGLLLKGYSIKAREPGERMEEPDALQPIGPGGGGQAPVPVYLKEIIARLNALFGDATPLKDQVSLVNQVVDIARESEVTMAQVKNADRQLALQGNLAGTVEGAIVRAMSSHQKLAKHLLKSDKQALAPFIGLIYELLKDDRRLDLGELGG